MTLHIKIFSDYICPFCYIGKGIIDRLKQEFSITEQWLPMEIHPETPPEGALLSEHLPHIDWDDLYRHLRASGKEFGIIFGEVRLLPNSRQALELAEYAREQGLHDKIHEVLFRAYFTDLRDIGDRQVLLDIACRVGLAPEKAQEALDAGRYRERLDRVQREARLREITGVPTFIINDKVIIVGAQPLDVFRKMLSRIQSPSTTTTGNSQ